MTVSGLGRWKVSIINLNYIHCILLGTRASVRTPSRDARESKRRSPETSDANGGALRKIYIDGCYIQLKFRLDIALYYFHEFF